VGFTGESEWFATGVARRPRGFEHAQNGFSPDLCVTGASKRGGATAEEQL